MIKKKRNYQNPAKNNTLQKMGITEEGIYMSDEGKKKAGLPGKKVMGLFLF